jgi:hypothetical protein
VRKSHTPVDSRFIWFVWAILGFCLVVFIGSLIYGSPSTTRVYTSSTPIIDSLKSAQYMVPESSGGRIVQS